MLSLVIPVYNESHILEKNVKKVIRELKKLKIKYEIIIAEDGSSDNTYEIALKIAKRYKNIKVLHSKRRLGKGLALKRAIIRSKYNFVGFMDIDLSTSLKNMRDLLRYSEEFDIVIGSRYLKYKKSRRKITRKILSIFYNFLVRLFFKSKITDHQCGFKLFKKNVAIKLNKIVESNHWFWDTEFLILAQYKKYKIKEIPVIWNESNETKINFLIDIPTMIFNILKLRFSLRERLKCQ